MVSITPGLASHHAPNRSRHGTGTDGNLPIHIRATAAYLPLGVLAINLRILLPTPLTQYLSAALTPTTARISNNLASTCCPRPRKPLRHRPDFLQESPDDGAGAFAAE